MMNDASIQQNKITSLKKRKEKKDVWYLEWTKKYKKIYMNCSVFLSPSLDQHVSSEAWREDGGCDIWGGSRSGRGVIYGNIEHEDVRCKALKDDDDAYNHNEPVLFWTKITLSIPPSIDYSDKGAYECVARQQVQCAVMDSLGDAEHKR